MAIALSTAAATVSEIATDIPLNPFEEIDSLPVNPILNEAYHAVFLYAAKHSLTTVIVQYTIPYSAAYQKRLLTVAILDGDQVSIDAPWTDSSEGSDKNFAIPNPLI